MNLDYYELWKEMCFLVEQHKFDSEDKFQIVIENFFNKLGWKQYLGEIIPQLPIHVGNSNYVKPDIVIKKENENVYVVEIKKIGVEISDDNVKQLKSYMRLLKLKFGVIIGKSIQLYYESNDNKTIEKICVVNWDESNNLGPQIIEKLSKFEFSVDILEKFCLDELAKRKKYEETLQKVEFLCSENGVKYVKELLSIEYESEVIEKIKINISKIFKSVEPNTISTAVPKPIIDTEPIKPDVILPQEWLRKPGDLIQDWVKRILPILLGHGYISDEEINKLHDRQYSRDNFHLSYPLLCDSEEDTRDSNGHARYWLNWKLSKYFVCSQWWLAHQKIYETKIYKWMSYLYYKN